MGLDMYLTAEVRVPKGSPFHKVIEDNLTDSHRESLAHAGEPDWEGQAYVSGWAFANQEPEALYNVMTLELGYEPHNGSPSFYLAKDSTGDFLVYPKVFYWRKANAIHRWFVQEAQGGVDECQETTVHPELLLDLVDRVERISTESDPDAKEKLAHELLPTQGGFFFGGTDYDEWYYSDIDETARDLRPRIEAIAGKASRFIYQSSW